MPGEGLEVDWRLIERRRHPRKDGGWQTSGGVVVDPESGRLLLVKVRRERRDGRRGWTWPKGRIDPGEGPVYAALREIEEEAGVVAEPLWRIALVQSRKALRHYFLLAKIAARPLEGREVLEVRWVRPPKAERLLERERDRRVLVAAVQALRMLGDGSSALATVGPAFGALVRPALVITAP
jgi:8-oxo-dGTP diphosphatase